LDPFANRDEALGFLHFSQGVLLFEAAPSEAAAAFLKAAQSNSTYKREASTYSYLASLYEMNELNQLITTFQASFPLGQKVPPQNQAHYDETIRHIQKTMD